MNTPYKASNLQSSIKIICMSNTFLLVEIYTLEITHICCNVDRKLCVFQVNMATNSECAVLCNPTQAVTTMTEAQSKTVIERIKHSYYVHL